MDDKKDLKDFDLDGSVNDLGQTYVEWLLAELRRMAMFVQDRYKNEQQLLFSIDQLLDKIKRMEDNGAVDPDPRKGNY